MTTQFNLFPQPFDETAVLASSVLIYSKAQDHFTSGEYQEAFLAAKLAILKTMKALKNHTQNDQKKKDIELSLKDMREFCKITAKAIKEENNGEPLFVISQNNN